MSTPLEPPAPGDRRQPPDPTLPDPGRPGWRHPGADQAFGGSAGPGDRGGAAFGGPEPTRLDSGRPHPAGPAAGPGPGPDGHYPLPDELARRFVTVDEITQRGASEALLYRVRRRDGDGATSVLKIYHPGRTPDVRVWAALSDRSHQLRHVVRIHDFGTAANRFWELMEYVEGESLADLVRRSPDGVGPTTIHTIVSQLTEALTDLHALNIPHRDIKPSNVLLRPGPDIDLTLIDFGISRVLRGDATIHPTASGTPRYQAPEAPARLLSTKGDWWPVGLIVMELVTGHRVFPDITDDWVPAEVSRRDPDLSEVTDPRLRLLCQGLLLRDSEWRWGADDVSGWLSGDSPFVYRPTAGDDPAPASASAAAPDGPVRPPADPFDFHGQPIADTRTLAGVLATRWELARRTFFGPDGAAARAGLFAWWARRTPPGPAAALMTALADDDVPPDPRLLRLCRALNPGLPPVYRGQLVTLTTLPAIAAQAVSDNPRTAPAILADLRTYDLLPLMEGGQDSDGLAEAHHRWTRLHPRFDATAAALRARLPRPDPADAGGARRPRLAERVTEALAPGPVSAYLMMIAVTPDSTQATMRREVQRVRRTIRRPPDWYEELLDADGGPTALLCAYLLAPLAREDYRASVEAELARARELLATARYDWFRRQQRPISAGWAAAGVTVVLVFWAVVITLTDLLPFASTQSINYAWAGAGVSLLVLAAAEGALALQIGGPYHPRYSLWSAFIHAAGSLARRMRPGTGQDGPDEAGGPARRGGPNPRGGPGRNRRRGRANGPAADAAPDAAAARRRDGMRILGLLGLSVVTLLVLTAIVPYVLQILAAIAYARSYLSRLERWRTDQRSREVRLRRARREREQRRAGPGGTARPA